MSKNTLLPIAVCACMALLVESLIPIAWSDDWPARRRPGELRSRELPSYEAEDFEERPGIKELEEEFSEMTDLDRWNMFYDPGLWEYLDPYNKNVLKGDIAIHGHGDHLWFLELGLISDSLYERRSIPVPVGVPSTSGAGAFDTLGKYRQNFFNQNIIPSAIAFIGNTAFKPPEYEIRIIPAINYNFVDGREDIFLVNPARGDNRDDHHIGFIELFVDKHLGNFTDRYDFYSIRAGIQRFNADFRGFLYFDDQPGVRLFGNYDNNRWQFNLAWFHRLDKDANSGLNTTFRSRYEDVFIANVYRQDLLALGHMMEGVVVHRNDYAGEQGFRFDDNGFLVRPASIGSERFKDIQTTYFGFNTDGHIGRVNTSTHYYYAVGRESENQIAQRSTDISAHMAAIELSMDWNWARFRTSFFYASGDDDPFDSDATGFDAIFDNPNFVGGDNSFWQRQGFPLIGGGGVNLVNRLSLLANLRAGKEQGQSNFVNPGIRIYNLGLDLDLTPELRMLNNFSYLQFDETAVLETVRQDGSIDRDIGFDLSSAFLYRPLMTQNIQLRAGASYLIPGDGIENLYGDSTLFSIFTNLILIY